MSWKQQFFKPRWLHKDPAVRRDAVIHGQELELLAALEDIFQNDTDSRVRAAAARRLTNPASLHAALASEKKAPVLEAIRERLQQLLSSDTGEQVPLAERLAIVRQSDDRDLLEAAAAAAPNPQVRSAALARVQRQGFLGDRAIADPDPEVRRQAAAAISQHSTLKRVIAATRTSDKTLHQQLSERLHCELLAAGDPAAIRSEALRLCESLEQSLALGSKPSTDEIAALQQQWAKLTDRAPADLKQRFERDCQRATQDDTSETPEEARPEAQAEVKPQSQAEEQLQVQTEEKPEAQAGAPPPAPGSESGEGESATTEPDPRLMEALESIRQYADSTGEPLTGKRIDRLAANWARAWAELREHSALNRDLRGQAEAMLETLHQRLSKLTAQREEFLEQAEQHLQELKDALEEGSLHRALEGRTRLQELGQKLGNDRRWKRIQAGLQGTIGQLRELRDWQHWANDKIRKRLIKEMDALPSSGLHPDAVLDRVKALQGEWKDLEASEQIPGDRHYAAAPWMWRKFNAAGRKAFETTKPFLDKRSELQSQRLEEMRALCDELSKLAGSDAPDWDTLRRGMGKARKALRELSSIPAKARQKTAKRLKRVLDSANSAMQGHYAEIEKQKLRLIREAALLQHATDHAEAIQRAKALQAEWKAAGSLWRRRENELWREFRAPLDPLFEQLDANRVAQREQQAERVAAQRTLCDELDKVLSLDDESLAEQHGRVQGLEDQWGEFRRPDRALQRRFEGLLRQFRSRERAHRRAAASKVRQRWWDKADLLHRAELALKRGKLDETLSRELQEAWPGHGGSDIDDCLDRRFDAALSGDDSSVSADTADTVEAARRICINLEFLAGLPTPEAEKELRMQYQVERLSAAMSGERERLPAVEEAGQLEREWLCLGTLPEREYKSLRKRLKLALEHITEE
jgi:hypothetical protein